MFLYNAAGTESYNPPQQRLIAFVFSFTFVLIMIAGFIFGIIGLLRVKKNPKITGRAHAIVGIILNAMLFFFGLLILGSTLFGG